MQERLRLLFVAEGVTLAHVARLIALAQDLDPARFDIRVAAAAHHRQWVDAAGLQSLPLEGVSPQEFLRAVSEGRQVYDVATLRRYVQDDLRLLRGGFRPDAVIGDFRISLSISARLERIPYFAVTNAYWSPACRLPFPMPVLPLSRKLPLALAKALFRVGHLAVMALHARTLNQVRREHGLAQLGLSQRRVYTDADDLLIADAPQAFPMGEVPPNHHWLGPVLWSPPLPTPDWWAELPADKPVVFVSLGSSGHGAVLAKVLQALDDPGLAVVASSAGMALDALPRRPGLWTAPYISAPLAAGRAAVVVCNGGSMMTQQALLLGRPVVGVADNMDQFLNMSSVTATGAGVCLRADRVDAEALRRAVSAALEEPAKAAARRAGQALREGLSAGTPAQRLARLLETRIGAGPVG